MSKLNIKTYVLCVLKPHIKALSDKYNSIVKEITEIANAQLDYIYKLEAKIAKLAKDIAELATSTLELHKQTEKVIRNQPTVAQVAKLERRVKELDYLTGELYSKYIELIRNGSVADPWVPEYEDTWIPGDPVLSDEELEAKWRFANNIRPDEELNQAQQQSLANYIADYKKHHPST